MQQILFIDQQIFFLINHLPHASILNLFFEIISGVGTAGIIWLILAAILFLKEAKKDYWFFFPVFLSAGISWVLVEQILKPLIGRVRPTVEIGAIIVGSIKDDASFPSGHATIAWAMAVVLSKKEPQLKWVFYFLALLISFSRIYLGKHFPLDVITGGFLGWGIGAISIIIGEWLRSMRKNSGQRRQIRK